MPVRSCESDNSLDEHIASTEWHVYGIIIKVKRYDK